VFFSIRKEFFRVRLFDYAPQEQINADHDCDGDHDMNDTAQTFEDKTNEQESDHAHEERDNDREYRVRFHHLLQT
jgi:hypothetical protein